MSALSTPACEYVLAASLVDQLKQIVDRSPNWTRYRHLQGAGYTLEFTLSAQLSHSIALRNISICFRGTRIAMLSERGLKFRWFYRRIHETELRSCLPILLDHLQERLHLIEQTMSAELQPVQMQGNSPSGSYVVARSLPPDHTATIVSLPTRAVTPAASDAPDTLPVAATVLAFPPRR